MVSWRAAKSRFVSPMLSDADIASRLDAAIARHEARDLDAAEQLYREILQADPNQAEVLSLLGLILQDRGQVEEATALLSRAIEIAPEYPEAYANLARGLSFRRDSAGAVAAARRATELDPDLGEGWLQLGRALLDLNNHHEAVAALRNASRHFADDPGVHAGLGYAAQQAGDRATAASAWKEVLRLQPDRVDAMVNLGAAHAEMNQLGEALEWHKSAVARAPDDIVALGALAATYHKRSDAANLVPACRAALTLSPDRPDILTLLGVGLMWLGHVDEALASCGAALKTQPGYIPATHLMGMLRPSPLDDAAKARLDAQLNDPSLSIRDRASAAFSLAYASDADGDHDNAFAMYQAANRLYRTEAQSSGTVFDTDAFRAYVTWMRVAFTPTVVEDFRADGSPSDLPVFIVGMPRSGTSLVEQIAASHPDVFGAGERRDIAEIVDRMNGGARTLPIRQWDRKRLRIEADEYVTRLRTLGGSALRVIDKMPDNVKALGQIRLLFPNARIIVCRRDPRDVCLSCFTTHFGAGHSWSWDLEDCAKQYVEIERLLEHWLAILPGPILEIRYEALVSNMEAESRRLISFLGLGWDSACLAFHATERAVTTASTLQVRKPLYTSSIGRWKRYEAHLGPMLRILADQGLLQDAVSDAKIVEATALKQSGAAMARRELKHAVEILRSACIAQPTAHEILANLALALEADGQPGEAVAVWRRALAVRPDDARFLSRLGFLLVQTGSASEGADLLRRAIDLEPSERSHFRALARALWEIRDVDGTREAYSRLLAISPRDEDGLMAQGHLEATVGRFENAAGHYRKVLRLNPGNTAARLGLVTIGKTNEAGSLPVLRAALGNLALADQDRILAGFALGAALDAEGQYDEAFFAYQAANDLAQRRGSAMANGAERDVESLVDGLIAAFPKGAFTETSVQGDFSELPVFIVGAPRSGTSLVEQILASHPLVAGAGERADIPRAMQGMIGANPSGELGWRDPALLRKEASAQVARLRNLAGASSRVIDKLPGNVFWLGHIRMMLPRARIIVCRRDARDIGLSCYTTWLSDLFWTADLREIGTNIRETDQIIAHWQDVLPGPMIEVQYEDLVQDIETQAQRLIDFLGLEWDPACLNFHLTERAVTTASVWQVRQKLYAGSIGRWRNYERHLGPLLEGLRTVTTPAVGKPGVLLARAGKAEVEKRHADAARLYGMVLQIDPLNVEAINGLGAAAGNQGDLLAAVVQFEKSLRMESNQQAIWFNHGLALGKVGMLNEAIISFERAIAIEPRYGAAHLEHATTLANLGRFEEALAGYDNTLRLIPNDPITVKQRGIALQWCGNIDQAMKEFDRAIALDPNYAEAWVSKAFALMMLGDFAGGWPLYEWRWRMAGWLRSSRRLKRSYPSPVLLENSEFRDRTILVTAEQGFGDAIHFCRYATLVARGGARVIVEVPAALTRLMDTLSNIDRIISDDEPLPEHDLHCPMMSLPLVFGTTIETIPAEVPYLGADATGAADWRIKLSALSGCRVGLVWTPGSRIGDSELVSIEQRRSVPLQTLAGLASVNGCDFVSLQVGPSSTQATSPPPGMVVHDFSSQLKDFADTAALVANLDLVISVDTAVAHLAGAMGKPIWLLNRFDTEWRWMLDRDNSPWYPTMRIFRQPKPGDWTSVIQRVTDALYAFAAD